MVRNTNSHAETRNSLLQLTKRGQVNNLDQEEIDTGDDSAAGDAHAPDQSIITQVTGLLHCLAAHFSGHTGQEPANARTHPACKQTPKATNNIHSVFECKFRTNQDNELLNTRQVSHFTHLASERMFWTQTSPISFQMHMQVMNNTLPANEHTCRSLQHTRNS